MGTFFAYTLYSGVFLLLLYLLYKLFLSREKQINLNRAVLLGCYGVAFAAWPLSHIEWHSAPAMEIPISGQELDFNLLAVNMVAVVPDQPSVWPQIILWIYLCGGAAVLLKTLFSMARLFFYIRKGTCVREDGYMLIVMPGSGTAPFSFGHYVVMSEEDYTIVRETVAAHELAHIRCRHYLDLLLAQTVCILLWYNPASWLMRYELKLIHEYQADAEVLNGGVDQKDYQMLLIRKTVGNRFHTLANNLNHSKLKNRIAMMQKEKSRGIRRLRLALLTLAPAAALALVNIPSVAAGIDNMRSASLGSGEGQEASGLVTSSVGETKSSIDPIEVVAPLKPEMNVRESTASTASIGRKTQHTAKSESLPDPEIAAEYPGGMDQLMRYLAYNIRYPEGAHNEGRQGKVIVGFIVQADGRVTNVEVEESTWPELDEEAKRVVSSMPKWTPATTDGKAVPSRYTIPINFRLQRQIESQQTKLDEKETPLVMDRNSNLQLHIGPCNESEHMGDAEAQAYRIDGKLVTERMVINTEDIETMETLPANEEFPNGIVDIKLKKK